MPNDPEHVEAAAPGPLEEPASGLLDRLTRRAAKLARGARASAEERRPAAEHAAREARERLRRAAEAAAPEMERIARRARAAVETARPHVEAAKPHVQQAAQDAVDRTRQYAREHEQEIRRAAGRAGRVAARGVTPAPLRPAVDAFEQELKQSETAGGESQAEPAVPPERERADTPREDAADLTPGETARNETDFPEEAGYPEEPEDPEDARDRPDSA